MFLACRADPNSPLGFPRIRGDVPNLPNRTSSHLAFSPHTRGCSFHGHSRPAQHSVFPAYAGMFRKAWQILGSGLGFPRIRGDVPDACTLSLVDGMFSPHTRGCSCSVIFRARDCKVFPAYAGMFRCAAAVPHHRGRFPRIRGDVPTGLSNTRWPWKFSPHTRGCSDWRPDHGYYFAVFPAYAGMFL